MSDKIKNYESVLLGDAVNQILGYTNHIPRVTEYQFTRDVIHLLKNPFDRNNLERYTAYVMELTRPLNVVATDNQEQVLFQVPALMMTPNTTMAKPNGMTAEHFFQSLKRDYELGGHNVNDKIAKFMMRITDFPDFNQNVVIPLRAILQRYGMDFDIPGVTGHQAAPLAAPRVPTEESFSDEYDED